MSNTLYTNLDKSAVTDKSLSTTCSFITNIAEGMKRIVDDMLPEAAEDQYALLCLLRHGLNGIEESAIDIMPDCPRKEGET